MKASRRYRQLIFFGYSEAEIIRLGDLDKLTDERMNELIHSSNKAMENRAYGGRGRNLLPIPEQLLLSEARCSQHLLEEQTR